MLWCKFVNQFLDVKRFNRIGPRSGLSFTLQMVCQHCYDQVKKKTFAEIQFESSVFHTHSKQGISWLPHFVVYYDQCLDAVHSKCWVIYAFPHFSYEKHKRIKTPENELKWGKIVFLRITPKTLVGGFIPPKNMVS